MKILFSPIGIRDPINEEGKGKGRISGIDNTFTEGSMLQCIRKVKPDVIYLYMTKEVSDRDNLDNRYEESINELYKYIGKNIEIFKVKREEMINPQDFNYFIKDFGDILNSINDKYIDSDIFVNISSGTAGMKSALYVVSSFSSFKINHVQVDAPGFKNNNLKREINIDKMDLDILKEAIELSNYEDIRAYYPKIDNITYEINKKILENQLKSYDYHAAIAVAEGIPALIDENILNLLYAVYYKSILDNNRKENSLRKTPYSFNEYKGEGKVIVDYLLYMILHVKRGLLLEFVRAITPFIVNVFELYIKNILKINIDLYVDKNKYDVRSFSRIKLEKTNEGKKIIESLNFDFDNNFDYKSPISSSNLLSIIEDFSIDKEAADICKNIRNVEIKIRNKVAHDIAYINKETISKETGYSIDEIVKMFKDITKKSIVGLPKNVWNTYDDINEFIIRKL